MRAGILTLLALALATPALAQEQQQPCRDADAVLERLQAKFGESPIAAGALKAGSLIVTESPETGTWTVLVSRPDGALCMLAAGEGWAAIEPEKPKPQGDPT